MIQIAGGIVLAAFFLFFVVLREKEKGFHEARPQHLWPY